MSHQPPGAKTERDSSRRLSRNLVEDNGFEPFAPGCKPGVLAKYTNPPNSFLVVRVTLEVTHSSV